MTTDDDLQLMVAVSALVDAILPKSGPYNLNGRLAPHVRVLRPPQRAVFRRTCACCGRPFNVEVDRSRRFKCYFCLPGPV